MSQRKTIHVLKLFCLCAALAVGAIYLAHGVGAQTPPAHEQTVEQVDKNIQVLKGLPASQLIPLMNFFNASLGVNCGFCHAPTTDPKTGRVHLDFASDAKEEKTTARHMIQMTMNINHTNKIDLGSMGITCYTCHRGSNHPAVVPVLPLPTPERGAGGPGGQAGTPGGPAAGQGPATAGGTAQPQPTPPPRPSAQQVLDKYIAAVGGREAVAKVQTRVLRGTRESGPNNWPLEVTIKAPDRFRGSANTPQGLMAMGYNGATGWMVNPQGQHVASPEELAALKHGSEVYELLELTTAAPTMRVTRPERIGDRLTNVITYQVSPDLTEKFYFDAETGLLLRRQNFIQSMLGPLPEQVDFADYRDVDGVKVPFTITTSSPSGTTTNKFTDIKFNRPVEDTQFQAPAAPTAPKP
jgi:photosynthetic reaction center cytochrome c subunit